MISLVINTYNEAHNIRECIESALSLVNEIIVVDMYSSDDTVKIAKEYNAKVYYHEKIPFVDQARNFAFEKAQGPWILSLDADERLQSSLKTVLAEIVNSGTCDLVDIPFKTVIFGEEIRYSGWQDDSHIRLFKKGMLRFGEKSVVHVPAETDGKLMKLKKEDGNEIIHYGYRTISQWISKMNVYTDGEAIKIINFYDYRQHNLTKSFFFRCFFCEFRKRYVVNKGYRDGLVGFIICFLQAFYIYIAWLKVWEMDRIDNSLS